MKKLYPLFALMAIATGLASCQKVIDVDLNSAVQQYVIEGEVSDGPGPYVVTVSRTKSFTEDNNFDKVSGAQVIITDATSGFVDTLDEYTPGSYRTTGLTGVAGHLYQLSVVIAGQQFSASSLMPSQGVEIDSLYASHPDFAGLDVVFLTPVFTDPAGTRNYYRLLQWVKGIPVKGSSVRSDDGSDGRTYRSQLFYDADEESGNPEIKNGDSVTVALQSINEQVYDYYRTLRDVTGSNSATPANPLTNITGGALGIFNTCAVQRKSAVASF